MEYSLHKEDAKLIQAVHDHYSAKAKSTADVSYLSNVAQAFGYTPEELQGIPAESNLGLSCGNPVAVAGIKDGERVLDLGSGGGIDVFLAASKVGVTGQAIGLDMSLDMINRARLNAQKKSLRPPQVSFVQASLTEPLPIASDSIDCILSNCVVNLLPLSGKAALLKEVYRVLKPGGRVVLDDIVAKKALLDVIRNDLASYVGCITGAIDVELYKKLLSEAGLSDVVFVDTHGDINVYFTVPQESSDTTSTDKASCCSPATSSAPPRPTPHFDANEWVASYQIYALKPKAKTQELILHTNPDPVPQWWRAYPTVKSSPESLSNDEVASMIKDKNDGDYAVIDVRRNDHAGGHVRDSVQFPAQTFYNDLQGFTDRFKQTSKVIFYCGSSNGRGPRCAGWYQDYLDEQGITYSKAYILQGGIKGWLEKFGQDDVELVDKD